LKGKEKKKSVFSDTISYPKRKKKSGKKLEKGGERKKREEKRKGKKKDSWAVLFLSELPGVSGRKGEGKKKKKQ